MCTEFANYRSILVLLVNLSIRTTEDDLVRATGMGSFRLPIKTILIVLAACWMWLCKLIKLRLKKRPFNLNLTVCCWSNTKRFSLSPCPARMYWRSSDKTCIHDNSALDLPSGISIAVLQFRNNEFAMCHTALECFQWIWNICSSMFRVSNPQFLLRFEFSCWFSCAVFRVDGFQGLYHKPPLW